MNYMLHRFRRDSVFYLCCVMLLVIFGYFSSAKSQVVESSSKTAVATKLITEKPYYEAKVESGSITPVPQKTNEHNKMLFDLSAVETLRLRVLDFPDLTGEYTIDSELRISLPGIGRIQVKGMSTVALEKVLERKVSFFANRDLKVSIEIVRFKPYYIVGMIVEPGANEWQPRLNVVKAIAIARGTVRHLTTDDNPMVFHSRQQSRTQLQYSLALLELLKAEKDRVFSTENDSVRTSKNNKRMSALIANLSSNIQPKVQEFIDRQSEIFDEQWQLMQIQIASMERELLVAREGLTSAKEQEIAVKAQLEIMQSLLRNIKYLKSRKLVSNSNYLTQRSNLMSSQIRYAEAKSLTERARGRVETVKRETEALRRLRKVALSERIETVQREITQLEVRSLSSNTNSTNSSRAQDVSTNLIYHIAREINDSVVTIKATMFTKILPGDVIVVSSPGQVDQVKVSTTQQSSDVDSTNKASLQIQRALESSSMAQLPSLRSASRRTALSQ